VNALEEMTIGKLAKSAGVGVETIRFYERRGLIRKPQKRDGGFRHYSGDDVSRVRFIKRAQELGFTLKEVKDLLDIQSKRKITGSQVQAKAHQKIKEIQQKLADLKRMELSLTRLAKVCGDGEQAIRECRIFDCFGKGC
jgi:Hg(II)-responsive transcriptional regulator